MKVILKKDCLHQILKLRTYYKIPMQKYKCMYVVTNISKILNIFISIGISKEYVANNTNINYMYYKFLIFLNRTQNVNNISFI